MEMESLGADQKEVDRADVQEEAHVEAHKGEEAEDGSDLLSEVTSRQSLRLRKRSLYHLRIGPTTVLPLVLVLHDPRQIETIVPTKSAAADEDGAAEGGGAEPATEKRTAPEFLRALTNVLRSVLAAYLVGLPGSGHVWLEVPTSNTNQVFSMPGWADLRFIYRFTPTSPRYSVMTPMRSISSIAGRKRPSRDALEASEAQQERDEKKAKKARQGDVSDQSENQDEEEDSERQQSGESEPVEAEEDDGSSDDDEEAGEDEAGDDDEDEEGLSEDELMERRRRRRMKMQMQNKAGYRGYAVTRHTLVVEALSAASAAAMNLDLSTAATTTNVPPSHKLSHYFSSGGTATSKATNSTGKGTKRQRKAASTGGGTKRKTSANKKPTATKKKTRKSG